MFVYYINHPHLGLFISESYEYWDECYEEYVKAMQTYADEGLDLSLAYSRGLKEQGV